jgi:hypothetical protein
MNMHLEKRGRFLSEQVPYGFRAWSKWAVEHDPIRHFSFTIYE